MLRTIVRSLLLVLIISLASTRPALAYIDPNTGGMLFQILVTAFGLFSGIALIFARQIRVAIARFIRFLRGLSGRGSRQAQHIETEEDR